MKKLDDTGLHATDCPCVRCEAGFRPTIRQRWNARRALDEQRRRALAAATAGATSKVKGERAAAGRLAIAEDVRHVDRQLVELRKAAPLDPRTALFLALRAQGKSFAEAESVVELRYPNEPPTEGIEHDESE